MGGIYQIRTRGKGPAGKLPLSEDQLREAPSGDLFGLTQSAGMGWDPDKLDGDAYLILNTHGGVRAPDERRLHWVTIPGTGRLGCRFRRRQIT